jgi:ATP-dependent Lon protease
MFEFDKNNVQLPEILPLLPARDVVVFPHMIIPLFVGRYTSITSVEEALAKDRMLFLSAQKDQTDDSQLPSGIYKIGTVCILLRMHKLSDGRLKILVQGIKRARMMKYEERGGSSRVHVRYLDELSDVAPRIDVEALIRNARDLLERVIDSGKILVPDLKILLEDVETPGKAADLIAAHIGIKVAEAQLILETVHPVIRLNRVIEYLVKETEIIDLQSKIRSQAKEEMSRTQKEYYLKEQIKAIKSELGQVDAKSEEIEELARKLDDHKFPGLVRDESKKQLHRLETMHSDSSEASIIRTYLDWIVSLPWESSSNDNLDLKIAKQILDEDHYDLTKVKERILDFLAVCKLKKAIKGPILCFVGPPGVGKTSLGKSIARSMNRKFVRISLGGIRDEAEIRGHRRTYIGAMPGRIIQGLKQAGTNNPVFMLDEVDKIGSDFKGDPSSALLEVLDPEQNYAFSDHYLNLPADLSKVLFIGTANHIDPIPTALKDRMEVIYLSGYSEDEKLNIAERFLVPKQREENGLLEESIALDRSVLTHIIRYYTKEAGLRSLERKIGTVFRKIARKKAENKAVPESVSLRQAESFLGIKKYLAEPELKEDAIGIATGMAWTQYGGELLYVESTISKGSRKLILTGYLGDVMKESAMAALGFIKAHLQEYQLSHFDFEDKDIHIHVPAGGIPKDGPSAGVTIATAILSSLMKLPIRREYVMTGEITLRGRVLPVGGIKEKVLAAERSSIYKVILPKENEKDVKEIPEHIRKKMRFYFTEDMGKIFPLVIKSFNRRKATLTQASIREKEASL